MDILHVTVDDLVTVWCCETRTFGVCRESPRRVERRQEVGAGHLPCMLFLPLFQTLFQTLLDFLQMGVVSVLPAAGPCPPSTDL